MQLASLSQLEQPEARENKNKEKKKTEERREESPSAPLHTPQIAAYRFDHNNNKTSCWKLLLSVQSARTPGLKSQSKRTAALLATPKRALPSVLYFFLEQIPFFKNTVGRRGTRAKAAGSAVPRLLHERPRIPLHLQHNIKRKDNQMNISERQ